jgi:serine protease Do
MQKKPFKARILRTIAAMAMALLWLNSLAVAAQAGDIDYSQIGWWQVIYKDTGTIKGCQAEARFSDQTEIVLALIQQVNGKSWSVYIANPKWNSWISKRPQHALTIALINPNKIWHGPWSVIDNAALALDASIDFVNSIADAKGLAIFDENERLLTGPLNMKDSESAIKAVVNCVRNPPTKPSVPEAQTNSEEPTTSVSGTAFFVAPNLLLTNNHVVKECRNTIQVQYPEQTRYTAAITGQDDTNDLALLRTNMSSLAVASFRFPARLGESVATFGFPYSDLLSSSGNFTLGSVTSLSGLKNDSRFIQIQAPVQPGNSGGPLLDMTGSVLGVVAGRLDAMTMIQGGGGVPQNINFAIQSPIVLNFLASKGVTAKVDNPNTPRVLSSSDVADLAKNFTVQVYCETSPPRTSSAAPPAQAPIAAIAQQAKEFVLALEAKWSRSNVETLDALDQIYEDEVMYFGKITKKDDVIKEKRAFAQKFPQRDYRPREPIYASCNERICIVSGVLEFRSIDPVAKIISEGVASFEYQLTLSAGSVRKISLENGQVLKRSRTPLALTSGPQVHP